MILLIYVQAFGFCSCVLILITITMHNRCIPHSMPITLGVMITPSQRKSSSLYLDAVIGQIWEIFHMNTFNVRIPQSDGYTRKNCLS